MEAGKLKLIIDHLELLVNSLKEEIEKEEKTSQKPMSNFMGIPIPLNDFDEVYEEED